MDFLIQRSCDSSKKTKPAVSMAYTILTDAEATVARVRAAATQLLTILKMKALKHLKRLPENKKLLGNKNF